jgi:hypothetical protein
MRLARVETSGATWASLLAHRGGPHGVYDAVLKLVLARAAQPKLGAIERVITGADEALAAVLVLRGPEQAGMLGKHLTPIIPKIGRKLGLAPTSIDELSRLTLLTLALTSETAGVSLDLPPLDLGTTFDDMLVNRAFPPADTLSLAFLSLNHDRPTDVRMLFGAGPTGGADAPALARLLARAAGSHEAAADVPGAWDLFVRRFPGLLRAQKAEWRHLVLAARLCLAKHGGAPVETVAGLVRDQAQALAAEGAS